LLLLALAPLPVLIMTNAARADCDVTDTAIPENAVAAIDVAGMRKSLAQSGIGFGGFYNAETFGNPSGGIKQGVTYDSVLGLHVNGDMQKLGFWKGLCLACTMAIRPVPTAKVTRRSVTITDLSFVSATRHC
jgi:carbohydrate-selective porin OprB